MGKRDEVVQGIVDQIVADMEKGVCPWEKPFTGGMPVNATTKKSYRGVNVWILWAEMLRRGFTVGSWVTYHQAMQAGGWIRRGEVGVPIVFYTPYEVVERDGDGHAHQDVHGREVTKTVRVMRLYTVFNLEQTGGLDHLKSVGMGGFKPVQEAERVVAATGAVILHRDLGRAFYDARQDQIVLPPRERFTSVSGFYGTVFHELAHWTGAPSRLARDMKGRQGDEEYAFEELVAEMGAAFTCAYVGIPYSTQHANYIGSWIKVLKDDKKALFRASAKGQSASDYILKYGPVSEA